MKFLILTKSKEYAEALGEMNDGRKIRLLPGWGSDTQWGWPQSSITTLYDSLKTDGLTERELEPNELVTIDNPQDLLARIRRRDVFPAV